MIFGGASFGNISLGNTHFIPKKDTGGSNRKTHGKDKDDFREAVAYLDLNHIRGTKKPQLITRSDNEKVLSSLGHNIIGEGSRRYQQTNIVPDGRIVPETTGLHLDSGLNRHMQPIPVFPSQYFKPESRKKIKKAQQKIVMDQGLDDDEMWFLMEELL